MARARRTVTIALLAALSLGLVACGATALGTGADAGADASGEQPVGYDVADGGLVFDSASEVVISCEPGEQRCDDPNAYVRCGADGRTWLGPFACRYGDACDPDTGECREGCEPGLRSCVSETVSIYCTPFFVWQEEPCAEGEVCAMSGSCVSCIFGSRRCTEDGLIQICEATDDGVGWGEPFRCGPGWYCPSNFDACVPCDDRWCLSENSYLHCLDDGEAEEWDCPEGLFCRDAQGCVLCASGSFRCDDAGVRLACLDFGMTWGAADPCREGKACIPGGDGACLPCGSTCLDLEHVLACDGERGVVAPCAAGEACFPDAGCRPCAPHSRECVTADAYRVCAPDGLSWDEAQPCTSGEICSPDAGTCLACDEVEPYCLDVSTRATCRDGDAVEEACGEEEECAAGECIGRQCTIEAVLLIDRSLSIAEDWAAVQRSVQHLVEHHPGVRFRLLTFPGEEGTDGDWTSRPAASVGGAQSVNAWFTVYEPTAISPLQPALVEVAQHAEELWTLSSGPGNARYLVVLSDGEGNVCVDDPFPLYADVPTGDCHVDGLVSATRELRFEHGVRSYVIGYQYQGNDGQLLAIAANGGTSFAHYVFAGSEDGLRDAFAGFLYDPKLCE